MLIIIDTTTTTTKMIKVLLAIVISDMAMPMALVTGLTIFRHLHFSADRDK